MYITSPCLFARYDDVNVIIISMIIIIINISINAIINTISIYAIINTICINAIINTISIYPIINTISIINYNCNTYGFRRFPSNGLDGSVKNTKRGIIL